jgi:RNA polymerase-binding transcription factor DksA
MDRNYFRKLRCRRIDVEKTLRHLEVERRTVERNTQWVDQAAYEARINLLDRLTVGYRNERHRIDDALERREPQRYGLCLSCHEPIEIEQLKVSGGTEFCRDCQPVAHGSQTGKASTLSRLRKMAQALL